jgi:N-6 DNA Methylase/Eco57I restriction-modification methylase
MDKTISLLGKDSPRALLDEAYSSLGYSEGVLLDAVSVPSATSNEINEWLEKGDWLSLANKIGAEKVFFVNNDPVIVFCAFQDSHDIKGLINTFRQAWCMARPSCLFLALPGELRVYTLNKTPARDSEEWQKTTPLAIANKAAEVALKLQAFRREEVESGHLFSDIRFGNIDERADRRLIQDLSNVRQALLSAGLPKQYAHSLIGRSIFVRYLEDRGVLIPKYFEQVAAKRPEWQELLSTPLEKPALTIDLGKRRYHNVLLNKEFTYALFNQLAEDFNGNMFPRDADEEEAVDEQKHLAPLRQFLLGEGNSDQQSLFFWAYDFEIIPVELISSIYEEFYHSATEGEEDDKGTHYTPSVLVDYILSRVLTKERLAQNPKVLDPACGSGIFLVEAFRRIVRYRVQQQQGELLSSEELRKIIRDQIAGIELNLEAARVAAFSLYLALLHYQSPPDILEHKRLPNLIYEEDHLEDEYHYSCLFNANTFSLTLEERKELRNLLEKKKAFAGRADIQRLLDSSSVLNIRLSDYDVIVGNPPWDEAGTSQPKKDAQEISTKDSAQAVKWAKAFSLPVGENSNSQLFIHRALSLVKESGAIGLLVHSSVIFNQRSTSQEFRQYWLSKSTLREIVNFVHVRRLFFDKAIAPFIFLHFGRRQEHYEDSRFVYQSARLTKAAEQMRIVVLTNADRRIIRQAEIKNKDYLWKTYWWGSHRDAALLAFLDAGTTLRDVLRAGDPEPGYGFQFGSKTPSKTLQKLRPLKSKNLKFYGPLKDDWFESPPKGVKRQPDERLYKGQRLLVVRGIKASYGAYARLERTPFSFRHTIYCVPLPSIPQWQAKLILGMFWSSLGRYRMFMTSGSWGAWYDQTVPSDILLMPIRLAQSSKEEVVQAVVTAVDSIRSYDGKTNGHFDDEDDSAPTLFDNLPEEESLLTLHLQKLDEAIYDLFSLSESQRALVEDFKEYIFDLFSKGANSTALDRVRTSIDVSYGVISTLTPRQALNDELGRYLYTFLNIWNQELEPDGEFNWHVIRPASIPMMAFVFSTQEKGSTVAPLLDEEDEWEWVLEQCEVALLQPVSQRVYIEGMIRVVTDTFIVIIKRDERRLWTRSMAREDAEATMLQAIHLQQQAEINQ